MKDKVVIIGGGLIGMLTAKLLVEEDYHVVLLEKNELGKESSWAGGGIISPLHAWRYPEEISLLSRYSQQHYEKVCLGLAEVTGVDPEWTQSGLLVVGVEEEWQQANQWAADYGVNLQALEKQGDLQALEPELNPAINNGLWLPEIAQLRNPRMMKSLCKYLLSNPSVDIHTHTEVLDVTPSSDGLSITTNKGTYQSEKVVVCQGAWSGLLPPLQDKIVIEPVRGQMIIVKADPGALKQMVLTQAGYLIPRRDGHIVCGSTLEFTGFEKETTEQAKNSLYDVAVELLPFLKDKHVEYHWCGLRPGSPNGIPYIGEHPEIPGLYVNAGHYRNGVVTGLASVKLLVDNLQQRPSFMDINRFSFAVERTPSAEFQGVT
jgi:glycine oxidase